MHSYIQSRHAKTCSRCCSGMSVGISCFPGARCYLVDILVNCSADASCSDLGLAGILGDNLGDFPHRVFIGNLD